MPSTSFLPGAIHFTLRAVSAIRSISSFWNAFLAFSFLQRGNLAEHAKDLSLGSYQPFITVEGLATGIDNVRTDVFLSPKYTEIARQHIARLISKHGSVEDLNVDESRVSSSGRISNPGTRPLAVTRPGQSKPV